MTDEPSTQATKGDEGKQPRESVILRIIHAINRRYHHYKRRQKVEDEHSTNERTMARWTRRVGVLTVVIALTSVVSARIFYLQYVAMNGQLLAMTGQLNAMTDQASITKAQISANFEMDEITHDPIISGGAVTGWWITPQFRNLGTTNALNVKNQFLMLIFQGQTACPTFPLDAAEAKTSVVPPQEYVALQSQMLTYADAVSASEGKESIYVLGRFQYDDIFPGDKTATVDWCVELIPNDITKNKFSPATIRYNQT